MASYVDIEGIAYGYVDIDPRGDAGATAALSLAALAMCQGGRQGWIGRW